MNRKQFMKIAVNRARPEDAEELSLVARAAKAHWGYSEHDLALWADDLTISPQFVEDNAVFCVERAGAPVGFCATESGDHGWEIGHLWVEPEHIGTGVGGALLRHAADWACSRGIETLRVVSDPHAEGFYAKFGARRVGRVPSVPEGRTLPVLELDSALPEASAS